MPFSGAFVLANIQAMACSLFVAVVASANLPLACAYVTLDSTPSSLIRLFYRALEKLVHFTPTLSVAGVVLATAPLVLVTVH